MQLSFKGAKYTCEPDETVLQALLRQNVNIPHSCRRQICLSCLMCSLDGMPPTASQQGLSETLKLQNYFLACGCIPEQDMLLSLPQEVVAMEVAATVVETHPLTKNLISVSLEFTDVILDFKSGQSVILLNNDQIGAQCSIVSPTNTRLTGRIEIHLDLSAADCFSKWAAQNLRNGIEMRLYGPVGGMQYPFTSTHQAILLVAKNSGLSPILGILQDIFTHQHQGLLHLFHEVDIESNLYLEHELKEITKYFPNFQYIPCVESLSRNTAPESEVVQRIRKSLPNLTHWKVFVCGPKNFVNLIQKQAYLAGCSMKDIFVEIIK